MTPLDALLAKQEIYEVLVRYCHGVDRLDEDLVRGIYHEDSYDDHGYWKGRGWDFAPFVVNRLREANSATSHSILNVLIDLAGDVAICESHVHVTLVRRGQGPVVTDVMGARYADRFSRRRGLWKIDERYVVLDWTKVETWPPADAAIPLSNFLWGRRDGSDAIQELLARRTLRPPSPKQKA